jgi:hypothetical protein
MCWKNVEKGIGIYVASQTYRSYRNIRVQNIWNGLVRLRVEEVNQDLSMSVWEVTVPVGGGVRFVEAPVEVYHGSHPSGVHTVNKETNSQFVSK